ncbi:S8 family peptidase [Actinomadura alba]|uniref:S8 family peptidase n=1 Tax=Actinomadura alba TaxID=406431 RepID=A0ABR7LJE9_9ACTN|nr:S8 family peptidase [Actinomadura alba]MBC6464977.1 S8 family peptidase [Actinomadura alba]
MSPTSRARRSVATTVLAVVALVLTVVVPVQASAAPQSAIRNAGTPTAIADSYIVVLKDSASVRQKGVASSARTLVSRHAGKLGHVYQRSVRGFSATMTETQARRLAADPNVAYVEQNQVMRAIATQPNPPSWGIDRIDQRNLPLSSSYTYNTTASNVTAYIIDTGILTTHSDFGGRARHGRDAVDNDNDATDCNGHGTHVAGTVGGNAYGVAKGVSLVAVRVLNCAGSGTTAGVVAGIDWVTANAVKPAVANMSLGGGASTALDNAVTNSINSGITYAIAAGNDNLNACNYSPARVPSAITVGATERTDARASYSNYGTCLDIFAPGSGITSAWHTSTTASNTISGTSMATPHVAGAAALVLAGSPSSTPAQVTATLTTAATPNVVTNPGTGSPNRLLFTTTGDTPPPPTRCTTVSNGTDYTIPDLGTVESPVTVSGCTGNASSSATAEVHIVHTWRGDLVIDLVAPDGSAYRLKNSSSADSADNVDATYAVNLSGEAANGTWRLRVQDAFAQDTGYINSWTLTL